MSDNGRSNVVRLKVTNLETAERTAPVASRSPTLRSRLSNGSKLLPMTDGRSATARRFKDLVEDIAADLGGKENLSEGQR